MARQVENFQYELVENKTNEQNADLSCTFVENMRDQHKATTFIFSPRRPGKIIENAGENSKSVKSTKSTGSNLLNIPSVFGDGSQKRKSLQILQPTADGQKLLVGGGAGRSPKSKKQPKQAFQSKSKQLKLHLSKSSKDSDNLSSSSEAETCSTRSWTPDVRTSSEEAYSLMVQDRAPEKYWELVAEERRKALEETLQENLKLYQMIEELKAENKALREKASHTDYYATMYKIMQDDTPKPEANEDA